MSSSVALLEDVIEDARSGFATGKEDPQGIFQVRMNNVTREGSWDLSRRRRVPATAVQMGRYGLRPGDILFNATNSPELVGKTALLEAVDEPMVFSNHFLRIRTKAAILHPPYLARWLLFQFSRGVFRGMCRQWVNQATVSRGALLATTMPLPPIEEQRRIADILHRADALRTKRREALTLLGDLMQSNFLDMFGNPDVGSTSLPIGTIGDLLESTQYGTSAKAGPVGSHAILRMGNVTRDGKIDLDDLKYIDISSRDEAKYLVRDGDLLFNRTNSAELVGKCAVYRGEPMAYAGYLVRLRMRRPNVPEYIAAFLNCAYGKAVLRGMAKSIVGMANINAKEVQGIRLGVPPAPMQVAFAERIAQIDVVRKVYQSNFAELHQLFSSLQQRAFAGEL